MTVSHPVADASSVAVDDALRRFLDDRLGEAEAIGPGFVDAVTELESYVLRAGKRVRPAFAWLGWIGAGGDPAGPDADSVLRACASLELLHASALIHDDIIDGSETRRGAPAAHVVFADRHRGRRWTGDPQAYGTGAAILVGDLALSWADDMFRSSGIAADAQDRAGPVWSAVRTEVLAGQLLDLTAEAAADEDLESALRTNRWKTAAYTVERPLHLGAAIAGAGPLLVAAYRTFGVDVGIAFQLRDDLLGVFADPAVTGKPSGGDLREGKRTALVATALRIADERDPSAAAFLRGVVGKNLSDADLDAVRAILISTGAVDRIERDIARRAERAIAALDVMAAGEGKRRLAAMAIRATQRAS